MYPFAELENHDPEIVPAGQKGQIGSVAWPCVRCCSDVRSHGYVEIQDGAGIRQARPQTIRPVRCKFRMAQLPLFGRSTQAGAFRKALIKDGLFDVRCVEAL